MDCTTNNKIDLTLDNNISLRIKLFGAVRWQNSCRPVYNARSFWQAASVGLHPDGNSWLLQI
jgi:hypothetical protein